MSIVQSVAMATNNRKDNHFLLFSTSFLSFLELSSVKYVETRQFCENDFRQYFNLKKWNIYLQDSQQCYSFLILIKKKKSLDKIVKTLYCEVGIYTMKYANFHKISPKETEGNTRKVSAFSSFACLWLHTISRRPREHAYQRSSGASDMFQKFNNKINRFELLYPT